SCTQVLPKPDGTSETITISSTYDSMGRKIKELDSRGYQTINTYDAFGRVTATTYKYSESDTLKQSTSTSYDANNMITYEKLADGTEKWYTYDDMYRVTSTRVKKGGSEETITTTYGYEDVDIYQGKGTNTVAVNNAYVTTQSYSDGTIISKTYEDHKGNLVRVYSGGLYTDMTYNSQGDMITKWVMGKTLSATDGVLQLFIHDDKGNLTQTITDPDYIAGTETTGYKVREDSTTEDGVAIQGSIVTKSTYDSDGNVTSTTDAEGNTTAYTYDRLGNLTSVLQPDNVKYEYQYEVQGTNGTTKDIVLEPRVTGIDAGRSMSKSVVTKDATDKVIKVEDFGTSDTDDTSISTSYEYDVRDNLIKSIEKNGNYKLYTYDSRDRVTSFDYYEVSGDTAVKTLRTEFTYDDSDNITSMTDKEVATDGTETIYRYTAYGYDGFNRLIYVSECDTDAVPTEAEIDANKVIYGYDIKDRMVSIDYPDSHEGITGLEFNYDSNSWLQNVTAVKDDGSTSLLRTYTYDNYGRTSEIKDYPDTINGTSKWIKRVFTYDKLDRTTGIEYYDNLSGNSTDIKASYYYTYDKNGNITSEEYLNIYGEDNGTYYG
ncbi:MAG: RHS repeat protein, partial [Lachnospiraceae bacterium]|nr:RHS repeat protein [Lachnospiraceae bacterium]